MVSGDLAHFLFEIASEERLGILDSLSKRPMAHAEIARARSMTGSETTRHLRRLVSVGLVQKDAAGKYALTPMANLLRAGLPFLDFVSSHRSFLLGHDLGVLDSDFLERIGELGHASFTEGTYQVIAAQESALRSVRRRIWVATEHRFEQAIPIFREKTAAGADVRVIRPRQLLEEERRTGRAVQRNFAVRSLPEVRLFLAVLDDQAGLCLPTLDGRVDMATMILLTDLAGYRWAEDLYLRLWSRADAWGLAGVKR